MKLVRHIKPCSRNTFMNQDGQHTQNTQRIQKGPQRETEGEGNLFSEACAQQGEASREQKPQRIIKLENSFQVKDPIRMKVNTTQEIEQTLLSLYPIDPHHIGMRFSSSREGTMHRKFIEGTIDPSCDTIYVKLYLKKH